MCCETQDKILKIKKREKMDALDKLWKEYLRFFRTLFWRFLILFVVINVIIILASQLRLGYTGEPEEDLILEDEDDSDLETPHDAATINSQTRSPTHLIRLAAMERAIVNDLDEHAKVLRRWLEIIGNYQNDYQESSVKGTRHLSSAQDSDVAIVENPIMAYRMIRRYTKLLRILELEIPKFTNSFLQKMAYADNDNDAVHVWPSRNDLNDAMDAILRLHHVYDLDLEEFTSGNLMGTETNVELDAEQCKEIGEFAVNISHFSEGIVWLETAMNKTMHLDAHIPLDIKKTQELQENIQKSLDNAVEKVCYHQHMIFDEASSKLQIAFSIQHDLELVDKKFWSYHLFQEKLRTDNNTIMDRHQRKSDRKVFYETHKGKQELWHYNDVNFWGLCTGTNMQSQLEISTLFCWYETRSNPAWAIYPLKVEQLSRNPYLIQIYEVLNNKIINIMKEDATPKLVRSHVVHSGRGGATYLSSVRTSVESRLDWETKTSGRLSRLVEFITGLITVPKNAAEPFLIASYAFGGHYACHLDALDELHVGGGGNRVATVMFYLSDVEIGGFTAFPNIGTAAKPIKGSAVFWYNLLKNGEKDTRTYHGACPVLLGHKWIATSWIRANAQLHTRPCALSSLE